MESSVREIQLKRYLVHLTIHGTPQLSTYIDILEAEISAAKALMLDLAATQQMKALTVITVMMCSAKE